MSVVFDFIKQIFAVPFGFVLSLFYNLTGNYLIAIIFLTILVKLCFLPSSIKEQKNGLKAKRTALKLRKIKELHADNPDRLKKEAAALQKAENHKKGNLGCLSFIVQIIVLIGLFNVIYTPLTNVLRIDENKIQEVATKISDSGVEIERDSSAVEITILKEIGNHQETLINSKVITEDELNNIIIFRDKYKFLGIDLSYSPEFKTLNSLWLIPLLVVAVGLTSALYSFILRKKYNPSAGKFTVTDAVPFLTPMTSFVFTFLFPAGVGLYWAISNLLSFIQTVILNKIYNPYKIELTEEEITQLTNGLTPPDNDPENADVSLATEEAANESEEEAHEQEHTDTL